jgi:hypothetical protein
MDVHGMHVYILIPKAFVIVRLHRYVVTFDCVSSILMGVAESLHGLVSGIVLCICM